MEENTKGSVSAMPVDWQQVALPATESDWHVLLEIF